MQPCPTCNFLLEPGVQDCRFCGTNIRAAQAAAEEAAAKAAAIAAATPPPPPKRGPVIAASAVGVLVVALVAFLAFGRGSGDPAAANTRVESADAPATTATPAPSSTTSLAVSTTPNASPGYTLFGVPGASANVELPTGSTSNLTQYVDCVDVNLGGGVGVAIGSVDELPVGGTASTLLAYMRQSESVDVGSYDDELSNLAIVSNAAGPAVSFDYTLDGGFGGKGTMVLINQSLILVQLVQTPGSPVTPQQLATYQHAVSTITPVL